MGTDGPTEDARRLVISHIAAAARTVSLQRCWCWSWQMIKNVLSYSTGEDGKWVSCHFFHSIRPTTTGHQL